MQITFIHIHKGLNNEKYIPQKGNPANGFFLSSLFVAVVADDIVVTKQVCNAAIVASGVRAAT